MVTAATVPFEVHAEVWVLILGVDLEGNGGSGDHSTGLLRWRPPAATLRW